jgi:uncharacterized hydrophobic protein (TIGR00271 family)
MQQGLAMTSRESHHAWHAPQDQLLKLLGHPTDARAKIVLGMLHRDTNEAMSYWLQLVVSIGIATLGLVVGSAAVVIGAMLIAPLMTPIIGMAMGLSTGSPFLVLRSAGRILLSVAVAVGGAGVITLMLPFHELNAEISARATPTALDLLTAAFCALAGVYAALRPGSDTATTAAGTSIGISLVPPLCASGYGLGTLSFSIAGGSALLFLTNLVAIVAVGTVAFVASGFNRVDVTALEREELARGDGAPIARRAARRLARLFESKAGPALRFIMPFALLGAVYVPLRRALDEVAWEVKARRAVAEALAREPRPVVQSKAQVGRHQVDLAVVQLGTSADADAARERLSRRIFRAVDVTPSIEVLAVPDAKAFAGLASTLMTPHQAAVTPPDTPPGEQVQHAGALARAAVAALWPNKSAGELLSVGVLGSSEPSALLRLRVVHAGEPLGAAAEEALSKALSDRLASPVELQVDLLPLASITRENGDFAFLARSATAVQVARWVPSASICVARPDLAPRVAARSRHANLEQALDSLLGGQSRVMTRAADDFELRVTLGACDVAKPAAP